MRVLARVQNALGGLSIARRLLLLGVLFALAMGALAWTLSARTTATVDEIAKLERSLERRSAIVDLESAIADYAAQLDARKGFALNRDAGGMAALDGEIESALAGVSAKAERLQTLVPEMDVASILALVRAFRASHDAYLRDATAGNAEAAAARFEDIRARRGAIDERVVADTAALATEFDQILGFADGISRDISLTLVASVTVMVLGTALLLAVMVFSIMRPLSRLTVAVDRLDRADETPAAPSAGPSEFRAIGRALGSLRQRLRAQQEAEDRLRASEAKLRQFLEASADMFWEMGPDLRYNWIFAANYSGRADPDRILGRTRWELVDADPDNDPHWRDHRQTLLEQKPFRNFEYQLQYSDDTPAQWIQVNGVPIFGPDGAFIGYRGTAVNVTEQRAVAEQLRQTQSREALGRLTGGVAHDFNNLLTVLKSNLELLGKHADLKPPFPEMIARCMRAIDRGARLTGQLLAFGRRRTLQPAAVDLAQFLDDFGQLVKRTIPSCIAVTVEVEEDLPAIYVDPALLQDALLNLVLNSRDAMAEGGALTLRALASAPSGVAALPEGPASLSSVKIEVCDTGTGIAADVRESVFEPFFTTKPMGEGSGLGLSMVRGFIEQSAGFVSLTSAPGKGTTVTLELPTAPVRAMEALPFAVPPASAHPLQKGSGETVLLVEDEDDVRESIASILTFLGYSVVSRRSGNEALKILSEGDGEIDVILSDVMMPGDVQGDELATIVAERYPRIPILLMCGYTSDAMRLDITAVGVPVLDKPVSTELLQSAFSRCMGGKEPTPAGATADEVPQDVTASAGA
ncbi:MAG: ATP-binding protein [Pseudomonadota bacterium]